jgi:hypothetical protein
MTASLLVLAFLSAASAGNDGSWCYRDFGKSQPANCSFYSARQCLIVAGTFGGVCERNNPPPPPGKGKRRTS